MSNPSHMTMALFNTILLQDRQSQEPTSMSDERWDTDWTLSPVDIGNLPGPSLARQHSGHAEPRTMSWVQDVVMEEQRTGPR